MKNEQKQPLKEKKSQKEEGGASNPLLAKQQRKKQQQKQHRQKQNDKKHKSQHDSNSSDDAKKESISNGRSLSSSINDSGAAKSPAKSSSSYTGMKQVSASDNWYLRLEDIDFRTPNEIKEAKQSEDSKKHVRKKSLMRLQEKAEKKREQANTLFDAEVEKWQDVRQKDSKRKGSDKKWLDTVMRSGTSSDKHAAMFLMVQESPMHRLATLDAMLATAKKKQRRESEMAMQGLRELFLVSLLPNRPMRRFVEQPCNDPRATPEHLLLWAFEEKLRERYAAFVETLKLATTDTLVHVRDNALKTAQSLLSDKPYEQRETLLSLLVNKLGDPDKKISSKVVYLLLVVVEKQPQLKEDIVKEIERFVSRPNVGTKAQKYAVTILNQIVLERAHPALADRLVIVYLTLFKALSDRNDPRKKSSTHKKDRHRNRPGPRKSKKGGSHDDKAKKPSGGSGGNTSDVDGAVLSALLIGLNRAFPFATYNDSVYDEHIDNVFRVVHKTTFNKSVQALLLLLQVCMSRPSMFDRFYSALYSKLLSNEIARSSKRHTLLLHVYLKALRVDTNTERKCAFVKRLLQACAAQAPSFICGSLLVISELIKTNPILWDMIHGQQKGLLELSDDEDESSEDDNDDDNDGEEVREEVD
eukprot:TRINITY_DN108_c1_g1_i1.p1 TRINITY_DN108_c1_g1~~TRINITY_DN108_c1_g1_i1.p1  ORF type:complete len:641 (+),score=185.26 TRINITY_DN108_c1_g1_i1:275-2197(+)